MVYTIASHTMLSSQTLPSFDQLMLNPLEEVKQGTIRKMDKNYDYVHILDSINLDMGDTLCDEHAISV